LPFVARSARAARDRDADTAALGDGAVAVTERGERLDGAIGGMMIRYTN